MIDFKTIKGWEYKKKPEKINHYLKELVKEYPAREIPLNEFLTRCSYDLGFLPDSFIPYVEVFKSMGYLEQNGENIISLVAKSRSDAFKQEREEIQKEQLSDEEVDGVLTEKTLFDEQDEKDKKEKKD